MRLDEAHAGPYLRALAAGVDALAPSDAHVPLPQVLDHLMAMDPALSGDILAPAEVMDGSGMPAWAWLERAVAEASLARSPGGRVSYSDQEIGRATAADPALGRRLSARASLHRFLRSAALLPMTRLVASLRRLHRTADVLLVYDRIAPDGRWLRLSMDLSLPPAVLDNGIFHRVDASSLSAATGVQHLLTRHATTPLLTLQRSVETALGGPVLRLSRGAIGPFWFPGLTLPVHAPACIHGSLVLHLSHELVSADVSAAAHRDAWRPPPRDEHPPEGQAIFRERRFAVSPQAVQPLSAWCAAQGTPTIVVPLLPRLGQWQGRRGL